MKKKNTVDAFPGFLNAFIQGLRMLNRVVWFIFSLLPLHFLFKQVCADLSAGDGGGKEYVAAFTGACKPECR